MRFWKVIAAVIIGCCFIVGLFIIQPSNLEYIDIAESNNGLSSRVESSRFMFKSYNEIMEAMTNGSLGDIIRGNTSDNSSISTNTNIDSNDLMAVAKVICSKFTLGGAYNYSQTSGSEDTIVVNSRSIATTHRDCSCFVSAMTYLSGMEPTWIHKRSYDFYDGKIGTMISQSGDGLTFESMDIGDIIAKQGHVAICVKKDNEYIYFADAGCDTYIQKTAENGWAEKYKLTELIDSWRKGPVRVWRV